MWGLHEIIEGKKIASTEPGITEERKANMGAINNDESVRLQTEPDMEEIERKSNKDKIVVKTTNNLPKIEEKPEEVKKQEPQNIKYQPNTQKNNPRPSIPNSTEARNLVEVKHENIRQMPSTPVKPQPVIDLDYTPDYTQRVAATPERNFSEQRKLPTNMLPNLAHHNINMRGQAPLNTRNVQSPVGVPMMGQVPHHLPGLSNIGLNLDKVNLQGMPSQFMYPMRNHTPYMQMQQPNFYYQKNDYQDRRYLFVPLLTSPA